MRVRQREAADTAVVESFLAQNHSLRVARLGRLEIPLHHPAFLAETDDGRFAGLLTYILDRDRGWCEILTLHAVERQGGAGTALIAAVERLAAAEGCERLWLITTNDNVDALRFYQRRGFRLAAVRPGAVDDARARLKPESPEVGEYGIPIRDELELEKRPSPA